MDTNNLPDEVMTFFKTLANIERLKIAGLIAVEELSLPRLPNVRD